MSASEYADGPPHLSESASVLHFRFLFSLMKFLLRHALPHPLLLPFACMMQLTACVKALTFPFTKMQVESSLAIQALQPRIKEIRRVFDGDRDKISAETSKLYQDANVNQSAGCLPLLLTWPVFIGLYRCFTTAANDGLFDESFLWIPTLAGPTTIESRSAGLGLAWLLPLAQDGAPPIGWHDALLYLSLPAALIASQYASQALVSTTPPPEEGEDQQWLARSLVKVLPLMVGYVSCGAVWRLPPGTSGKFRIPLQSRLAAFFLFFSRIPHATLFSRRR